MALCVASSGCSGVIEQIMLDGMIRDLRSTEGGIETVHDFDVARQMSESSMGQLEGLYRLDPDDDNVHYMLTRAWASTGARFMLDAHDSARATHNAGLAVYQRTRIRAAFLRARFYAERWLMSRDDDFGTAVADPTNLRKWLDAEVDNEEDAALLLWAGLAWAGHSLSTDAPDSKALITGRTMIEHSIALNEGVEHGLGHVLLALDLAMRRDPSARRHADQAIEITKGRYLPARLAGAVVDACRSGDAVAFRRALDAIIRAGDPLADARLENLIAQRRARRYRDRGEVFGTCPLPGPP